MVKQHALTIAGEAKATEEYLEVRNPSTGEVVGLAPQASTAQLDKAVAAAGEAFQSWRHSGDAGHRCCR